MALTTLQKTQAALAVPCTWHRKPAGEPCPVDPNGSLSGVCMDRRADALGLPHEDGDQR